MTAKELKKVCPLYPGIRVEKTIEGYVVCKTIVRKRYDGKYYLKLITNAPEKEAKSVHELHTKVYRYLMLKAQTDEVLDDDQVNEVTRLTKK